MKRIFLYGALVLSISLTAQQQRWCGFDQTIQEQDKANPGLRQTFDKIIQKIHTEKKNNSSSAFGKTVNGVYEIPVVVHLIYPSGAAVGSTYNKTDAQIQAWLDRANQMYAGTYAWPAAGIPADFGQAQVFPIKLVLAKRDPNCNATTGVVRYDGGTLAGYNASGMAYQTATGASRAAIKGLAPHWPEASYFNIYVISMFDADPTPNAGLMGFAAFPNNLDANYESFMKSGVVTNAHDTTFAHEFGHAMGLYHTFQGGTYDAVPGATDFCPPTTGVCASDDDGVCDTERAGSGYTLWPVPTNSQLNPCTGVNYQGVQYNMMNYSNSVAQKFTSGQGDRINALFMLIRSSLTTSKGATALPATPVVTGTPIAAACTPPGVTTPGSYLVGPTSVKLGQIDNSSAGYWAGAPSYYIDYTTQACRANSYTELLVTQAQTIQVGFVNNDQSVRAWIDYNNNGTFEASELVATGDDVAIGANGQGLLSATFTAPASTVLNTPLRMRVIADAPNNPATMTACGQLAYGQAEDYTVKFVTTLGTADVKASDNDFVIYPNPSVAGDKVFIKAKNAKNLDVTISDMSGRLVATPSLTQESNGTFRVNHNLEKGVYMVQISNGKDTKTAKLIIK
ncbi:zinc-dependent metalloprotease [Chryseobacterium limigenitum]|uniref:Por secretion system C-terminal sorting domain-containing protein n=1 Tax=Chryseobacterium limigenitum TaxID=1612149 RepID=A0A1K2ITD7_9FLAO|nr:GEVED domain-containing protein [Chryseobacterium limigenitum]SFZ95705.1 Por secretion system C-terminal sorting domain-containing protein [Chryseobacterium limigenitum]